MWSWPCRKQDVAGFLVAAQLQGHVLIQQLLDGGVHLVFVALFLRREGESDELRGELRHGDREGGLVVAERVAVRVFFSLPTANDRARGPSTSLQGVCVLPSR